MKATYGEITTFEKCIHCAGGKSFAGECWGCGGSGISEDIESREIFKDPITDDGTKKSKKGLLHVYSQSIDGEQNPTLHVTDQCTWEEESQGLLTTVFLDGKLIRETILEEIRNKLNGK